MENMTGKLLKEEPEISKLIQDYLFREENHKAESLFQLAANISGAQDLLSEMTAELKKLNENLNARRMKPSIKEYCKRKIGEIKGKIISLQKKLVGTMIRIRNSCKEKMRAMRIGMFCDIATALHIKEVFQSIRTSFMQINDAVDKMMDKVCVVNKEMKMTGGHLKNVARGIAGKETKTVTEPKEPDAFLKPFNRIKELNSKAADKLQRGVLNLEQLQEERKGPITSFGKPNPEKKAVIENKGRECVNGNKIKKVKAIKVR